MAKKDTRIQITKKMFKDALLSILKDKPIERITVKELCEIAGLNRSTFYLHYGQPVDVLLEIQHDFMSKGSEFFSKFFESNQDVLCSILTFLRDNRDIASIILGKNGNDFFVNNIKELMIESIKSGWRNDYPNCSEESMQFMFPFIMDGSMNIIVDWLNDDGGISANELSLRLNKIGDACLRTASEFD